MVPCEALRPTETASPRNVIQLRLHLRPNGILTFLEKEPSILWFKKNLPGD